MKEAETLVFFDEEKELALRVLLRQEVFLVSAVVFDWESVPVPPFGRRTDWGKAVWEKEPLFEMSFERGDEWVTLFVRSTPMPRIKIRAMGKVLNDVFDELVRFART